MLKFTLMKQLYYALDPRDIPEVNERRASDIFHRTLDVRHLGVPNVHEMTAQERYLPYSQLYFLYINDERAEADLADPRTKALVLAFFRHYHPEYLKESILQKMNGEFSSDQVHTLDLLDCFETDRMPGYHDRTYAYRDLITMEDIRKGVPDRGRQKHGFPGLSFSKKYQDR